MLNKRVLVTGGAGFIGSHLVERLVKEGAQVTVLDDYSTGDNSFSGVVIHIHSVTDTIVDSLVKDSDIVYHLAARNIIASINNPIDDYSTNIGGTLNVLMACRTYPVERLIYTSSTSVYGNPKHLPISEDDGINLLTPYAVSKYAGEGYCSAFYENYDVPTVVLRLSNVYGPRQKVGVFPKFMNWASKGEPILVHGDGLSTRDFTYIDDVVDALILAGTSPKAEGEVFNVATGIETDILELANEIAIRYIVDDHYTDEDFDIDIVHVEDRDIDNIRRRVLNIEKIRRKLGWTPKYTLERGLSETKKWRNEHGN